MGYLHEGHRALLRAGRARADLLVCSIFVNPTQFGAGEDFERYPRDLERDLEACVAEGVDLVFAPAGPEQIYPQGFATTVRVEGLTRHLCGASRPGHFEGVATIVTKLFGIVRPDVAFFGEKDFQQLAVIRRLCRDLDLDVEVVGVPTVREADGLALSSRNAYLDEDGRRRALSLVRALRAVQSRFAEGERRAGPLKDLARGILEPMVDTIDYVELAHPDLLEPLAPGAPVQAETRLFLAAIVACGSPPRPTRLIDNGPLGG
jgi:pantoate--beta-alanine ligase